MSLVSFKKITALLSAGALLMTSLSGCVSSVLLEDTDAEAFEVQDVTKITFSWWGNDDRHKYTMDAMDIFQEQNPDIEISPRYAIWQGYEKRNQVRMESHTEADVMQINFSWISQYAKDGEGYYDLYQLADYIDLSQFREEDLKYSVVNGKLVAIPIAFNASEFFYNKTVWDRYGLDFPTKWEDFFEAAKVMHKDGIYPLGAVKKQLLMLVLAYEEQYSGKPLFNDDGTLNCGPEEFKDMFVFYERLINENVIMPVDEFSNSRLADGKVASTICWVSDAGRICEDWEAGGYEPALGGQIIKPGATRTGWYIKPATLYAISEYTEHPQEAARLMNFLLNSEDMAKLQLVEKGIPISSSALKTLESMESFKSYEKQAGEYMIDHLDKMTVMNPAVENGVVINAFKSCADDYIYGAKTLEQSVQDMYHQIEDGMENKG